MVCTGDILVFGVQMPLTDVVKYILKFAKANIDKETYIELSNNIKDKDSYEAMEHSEKFFKQLNMSIEIIRPRCCLYDDEYESSDYSKVYLGVELHGSSYVSRYDVENFDSFEEYKKSYLERINIVNELMQKNKNKYLEDLSKILPKKLNKPKFYVLPNDCFSCT
jgi:hypothetical protein